MMSKKEHIRQGTEILKQKAEARNHTAIKLYKKHFPNDPLDIKKPSK